MTRKEMIDEVVRRVVFWPGAAIPCDADLRPDVALIALRYAEDIRDEFARLRASRRVRLVPRWPVDSAQSRSP